MNGRPAVALLLSLISLSFTPEETARKLTERMASLKSLQAAFEQTYYPMSMTKPLREKGKFYFRKPGLMRWEYADPEEKIYIYRDGVFLSYFPEEKQLIRSTLSKERYESEILGLLSGAIRVEDRYDIEPNPFPTDVKAVHQLKLTPKDEGEYSHILLEIDGKTWLLRRAVFLDWAGNKQEFFFSRVKADAVLSPELFELKVPPDCEIIDEEVSVKKKHPISGMP